MLSGQLKLLAVLVAFGSFPTLCVAQASPRPAYRWTQFVQVEGQPEPVPAEWVATPEGKFAHSIKIPNPVPKDSGYRPGMTSEQYFNHLCMTEAGEFIYKTVENVEGFYFMRPPKRPRDDDLKDRYRLEAPDIERTFQLMRATTKERATIFIAPPRSNYKFVEEPRQGPANATPYARALGYVGGRSPMQIEPVHSLKSIYGMMWRGIIRPHDRELAIAGSEWIVYEIKSRQVLGVIRNYGRTGRTANAPDRIWWLNALSCPIFAQRYKFATSERISDFAQLVMKPIAVKNEGVSNGK